MKKNTSWKFMDESSVTFQLSVSGPGEFGLSVLEPHRMDSLGHQHGAKEPSPKITLHFKVLCNATFASSHFSQFGSQFVRRKQRLSP